MNQNEDRHAGKDMSGSIGRRSFLGALGLGAAAGYALAVPKVLTASPSVAASGIGTIATPARRSAMNVIMLVSDGMSTGTLQLADIHQQQTKQRHTHWISLIQGNPDIRRSIIDTTSFNSLVTDSAAAATAWGIGKLVENGRIGESPDGVASKPILLRAKEAGKATGLVTTTRITHATPAGIACNILGGNRNNEAAIAEQLIDRGYDLLLGGGERFFKDGRARDAVSNAPSTLTQLRQRARDDASLRFAKRPRLVGLFSDSHMAYELDRSTTEPSLAEMTRTAIRWLSDAPGGYFLQIEGGRVDHAAHNNDAASLIADQIAFDDAVRIALDYAQDRDDTLVIITTDHGNANPGLTDYTRMGIEGFARIGGIRRSFDWILDRLKPVDSHDRDGTHAVIEDATGISISNRDLDVIVRWRGGEAVDPFLLANRNAGPLGSVLANYTKVAFLSPNHTSDFVELTVLGPGKEHFAPVMRISEVHDAMCKSIDIPLHSLLG